MLSSILFDPVLVVCKAPCIVPKSRISYYFVFISDIVSHKYYTVLYCLMLQFIFVISCYIVFVLFTNIVV